MEALASLWATLKAYQGPLVTLALIFGPGLLRRLNALLAPAPPDATTPPRSRILWSILLLHAVYAILLVLRPSYDAFTSLDLLAPSDILRPFVLHDLNQPTDGWTQVDPLVELFLARLGTVEGRIAYSRWGHDTFFNCAWCRQRADYALAATPRILGPYVLQALVLGALGWNSVAGAGARERAKKWRHTIGCGIAVCAAVEFGVRWWVEMRVVQGHLAHLSPTLTTTRVIAQLSLTVAYILLPVRPSPADLTQARLTRTLDAAYNTLNLAQAARAAITRSPAMSRSAAEWATIRAKAEDNARSDAAVVGAALDSGVFERSASGVARPTTQSREGAGQFVRAQWARVVRQPTPDTWGLDTIIAQRLATGFREIEPELTLFFRADSLSATHSTSSTPAKRSNPSKQDRVSKRHSPSFPTAGTSSPSRARASVGSASAEAATPAIPATTSPWGPSINSRQHATMSGSNASEQGQVSTSFAQTQAHIRSHSATSAQPQSGATPFSLDPEGPSASSLWTRRHSLTSTILPRPFDSTGELSSTPSTSSVALASQDQQGPQFNPETVGNRAGPSPNRAGHSAVARSPAFPRGLEQEEVFGDLSILGYPVPQHHPSHRAPERLADTRDGWGNLSDLGPVRLVSVGDWQPGPPNGVETLVQTAAAAHQAVATPSEPHVVTPSVASPAVAEQPQAAQASARQSALLAQAVRDLELIEARVRRLQRTSMAANRTVHDAGDSDNFLTQLRQAGRIAEQAEQRDGDLAPARTAAREEVTSARGNERPQRLSMVQGAGDSQTPQPNATPQVTVATTVQPLPAASADIPVNEPVLGSRTTVPRVERNNAVRDWRNGVAQQPQLPPYTPWDAQPNPAPAESSSQATREGPPMPQYRTLHVPSWSAWRPPHLESNQAGPSASSSAAERQQASQYSAFDSSSGSHTPNHLHSHWNRIRSAVAEPSHQYLTFPLHPSANPLLPPATDANLHSGPNPFEHPPTRLEPGSSSVRARNLAWRRGVRELGSEREPDIAGAPPAASGLRPLLLGTQPPFRVSPNWDESGRPFNRPINPAERRVPSPASSARGTSGNPPTGNVGTRVGTRLPSAVPVHPGRGDPLAAPSIDVYEVLYPHNSVADDEAIRNYFYNTHNTVNPFQHGFRPIERSPVPVPTYGNSGRADGGDPVDLSDRTLRRSGTQPNLIQPPSSASGAPPQAQLLTPASGITRHRPPSMTNMFAHEDLYARMAVANSDPEERAVRLLAVALLSLDPKRFIDGKVSARDDFRLYSEMTPAARTKLFTRVARAVAIFPMLNRRQFMTNVLARSRWANAQLEGEKDESCAICQDDYEPSQFVLVTPCNHMYHSSCLERWIKTPNVSSCPMCRRDLALLHATSLLCDEGKDAARKVWMQMPTDLVPPRDH
ncbi:hypothetical protein CspHIS471_0305740 [Cutaneotrichosporon sp. HIS471]|nr:hypothetical protein CspHIS471_0305740 [Cutaneotrichosporon sp. HIS471]